MEYLIGLSADFTMASSTSANRTSVNGSLSLMTTESRSLPAKDAGAATGSPVFGSIAADAAGARVLFRADARC